MIAMLIKLLSGPLVTALVAMFTKNQDRKLSEAEIQAEVQKAVMEALVGLSGSQVALMKAEIQSDDPWVRRWRPFVAVTFAGVLLWYAVAVPILVNWYGFPPLRVGDKLLEWLYLLLASCLGAFTAASTLEKIALAWRR